MTDDAKVTRHEIMEERGNRDAFRLCVLVLIVVAIIATALGVVGTVVAMHTHFLVMPLPSREVPRAQLSTPRAERTPSSKTAPRSVTARRVDPFPTLDALIMRGEQTCGPVPFMGGAVVFGGLAAKAIPAGTTADAAGPQQFSRA